MLLESGISCLALLIYMVVNPLHRNSYIEVSEIALFLDFLCGMLQDPGSSVGYPFIGLFLLTKIHPGFA